MAFRHLPGDLRRGRAYLRRQENIRRYLETHAVRKLQIGAGPNALTGWLNADFTPHRPSDIFMDATRPFPLPADSFDFVFSEHMIEHVQFAQGRQMIATHVSGGLENDPRGDRYRAAHVINNFFWDFGHYFVYDLETLVATLGAAGFLDAVVCAPGESTIPDLCGLESHGTLIGEQYNRFETMIVEARKP